MQTQSDRSLLRDIYSVVVNRPWLIIITSLLLMIAAASSLPSLLRDTRADAFLAPDNPALVYRDRVKAEFGLSDPLVVAVIRDEAGGVFNPPTLELVSWLSNEIALLPNVNNDRLISLATEKDIVGTEEGMEVNEFLDPLPRTQAEADAIRTAIDDFPLYQGSLVARDHSGTLIVVELIDEDLAEQTYNNVMAIVARAPMQNDEAIHVAGEGAVVGYLGSYIDADASRLNPLAALIITLIVFFAFRRITPALFSNVIVAASVLMTLGIMAASGVAFFVITNAMPVILIGISVADSIHIYNRYFELKAEQSDADHRDIVISTMEDMWRPVTLTTLTTMAGFMGLFVAAYMPPFKFFGLFTSLGVCIAGVYSLLFIPAVIALTNPKASKQFQSDANKRSELFSTIMIALGKISRRQSVLVVAVFAAIALVGMYSMSGLTVNEDRITTFATDEPIYLADRAINQRFDGSNTLDIVIETNAPEQLFQPDNLRKIEALQAFTESLPHVNGSTSVVDYLKQMNRALNYGERAAYVLPDDSDLIAQYFLLYSASSDPTDFEEEVDYDYQTALVRVNIDSGSYQDARIIIEALEDYIAREFNSARIRADLSGRVNLSYNWIRDLGSSHFFGVGIALLLVWVCSAVLFRSALAGIYCLLPVATSILLVYTAMVVLDIPLGIGTSMFASVAIGLGVDFAIHTIDQIRANYRKLSRAASEQSEDLMDRALQQFFPSAGRALLLNFLAIACGFGVLISSKVVPLNYFGTVVVVAVSTAFLASLTLLPALINIARPGFIVGETRDSGSSMGAPAGVTGTLVVLLLVGGMFTSSPAKAADVPAIDEIVARINAVDDGEQMSRTLTMQLIDRNGRERERETYGYRKYFGEEKRSVLFYRSPTNVRGTGFLTWDYPDPQVEDDQWLYLPALRRVRRISASDRGDYFLGTDLTYEDIKLEGKLQPADYIYSFVTETELDGIAAYQLRAVPKSPQIADELGYGEVMIWVSTAHWLIVRAEYKDPKLQPLKTTLSLDIRQVDGIWTRHRLEVSNHQTGHQTVFEFSDVDYKTQVDDGVFEQQYLPRGR